MSWWDRLLGRQPKTAPRAHYDAASPSRYRKYKGNNRTGPNAPTARGADAIRTIARDLQRNHDLTAGAIRVLTNNTVGPRGIGIEPQPRRADGTINETYAAALREAWRDWTRYPEVSHRFGWAQCQRLLAASWFRDGEAFAQILAGPVPLLNHATRVPLSVELFEADMIPLDYTDLSRNILQGIQRNAWGQWTNVYAYKSHPAENPTGGASASNLKAIPAERILQIATLDRIGQLRGVSEFARVLNRLDDLKDYEESERIAAKVAAAMTAYIKKGTADGYTASTGLDEQGNPQPRDFSLAPGTVIDSLYEGEEIGLIDPNRPNTNAVAWRQGQLKAVAAGLGASYSSIARDYDGNYSAQRQEMIEQWVHYATLADEFTDQIVAPVWSEFVKVAHLSGIVRRPGDVPADRADDALYIAQQMPWIDPLKEANAWIALINAGLAAEVEPIRKRGVNPRDVLDQIAAYRDEAKRKGVAFPTSPANPEAPALSP